MSADGVVYCPSSPVIEDGKQVGWFYGIHVINEPHADRCQRCGMELKPEGKICDPITLGSHTRTTP